MNKTSHQIKAEVRTILGRKVKQLRRQGIIPATVYGHGVESISIQMNEKEIDRVFEEAGESSLVNLEIDGKTLPVLFKNPQYHPVSSDLIHLDCYKVNLKEKIVASVPIEFIGESMAVKLGNVLVEVTNEVEVEALPTDLPEKIIVDIAKLETLESQVTVADLEVDRSKVEIKTDATQVVVKVEEPRVEEEALVEASTETVVAPAMNQKTPEELAEQAEKEKAEKEKEKKG